MPVCWPLHPPLSAKGLEEGDAPSNASAWNVTPGDRSSRCLGRPARHHSAAEARLFRASRRANAWPENRIALAGTCHRNSGFRRWNPESSRWSGGRAVRWPASAVLPLGKRRRCRSHEPIRRGTRREVTRCIQGKTGGSREREVGSGETSAFWLGTPST